MPSGVKRGWESEAMEVSSKIIEQMMEFPASHVSLPETNGYAWYTKGGNCGNLYMEGVKRSQFMYKPSSHRLEMTLAVSILPETLHFFHPLVMFDGENHGKTMEEPWKSHGKPQIPRNTL